MLKDTRAIVAEGMKQGKTVQQMKDEQVLAKFDSLGKGFIKTDAWIDLIYKEVTRNKTAAAPYQNHGHAQEKQ